MFHFRSSVLTLVLAVASIGLARAADDEIPSFKKRGDVEKTFVTQVGTVIVKAARSKPQKVGLLSHEYKLDTPKKGRAELVIKMEYYGLVTKKRYTADIVVALDTSDKENWEAIDVRYSDTNPNIIGANEKKIQDVKRAFNK